MPDGSVVSLNRKGIVSTEVLEDISSWIEEGCEMKDVITRLRQRTVPVGYSYHSWITGMLIQLRTYVVPLGLSLGKEEDETDMLRSILAQYEYSSKVKQYCADGVHFDNHLHIPEVHKLTGEVVCQREDEGHLFKVKKICDTLSGFQFFCVELRELPILLDKGEWMMYALKDLWKHCKTLMQS